jgi:hypothetical protein
MITLSGGGESVFIRKWQAFKDLNKIYMDLWW